jgi:sigma-E factor negative regulatory protein RseA
MNEKLSALMDGELDRGEAMAAIKTLGQDVQQRGDWDCYHLIGDALRGDSSAVTARRKSCAESIFARLASEPTILAPAAISVSAKLSAVAKPAAVEKKTRMVLAMAASVVTVTAIGVIALRQQNGIVVPLQVAEQTRQALIPAISASSLAAGEIEANKRVNDYLAIHRQFANASAFQPASLRHLEPRQAAAQ